MGRYSRCFIRIFSSFAKVGRSTGCHHGGVGKIGQHATTSRKSCGTSEFFCVGGWRKRVLGSVPSGTGSYEISLNDGFDVDQFCGCYSNLSSLKVGQEF